MIICCWGWALSGRCTCMNESEDECQADGAALQMHVLVGLAHEQVLVLQRHHMLHLSASWTKQTASV